MLLAITGAATAVYLKTRQNAESAAKAPVAVVRTVTVGGGPVDRILRLTGTTAAENFVSLIAPQLGGRRSFSGGTGQDTKRTVSTAQVAVQTNTAVSSGVSSSPSSSSGTTSASLGGSNSALGLDSSSSSGSSSGGGHGDDHGGSSSSRFQAATTRGGSSRGGSGGSSGGGGGGSAAAVAIVTGGGGGGAGGPGGGGSDFTLILQSLTKAGLYVKKGETVAEFDRQFMTNRLDDFKAGVVQQQNDMKKLVANLEVTQKTFAQAILSAKGTLDKAELDLKTTPVRSEIDSVKLNLAREEATARYKQSLQEAQYREVSERASIRMEELDFQTAQLELKRAEANADRMLVKAPLDGLVVMSSVRRGTDIGQIQEGDQLYPGQFFMQIVDTKSMVVNANVNQTDVELLRIGQKATVRFDAYPDLRLPAQVYSIGAMTRPGGMRASFVREVPIRLKLERTDPRVIPDLSVSVDVQVQSETEAASVVPLGSVFRDGGDSKPYVYVKAGTGFERREVDLGLANYVAVAVRSGLRPGDVIAAEKPPKNLPGAKEQ